MLIFRKSEEYYADDAAHTILKNNHLADFEALWNLDAGWFETPNQRRGGWSGVSRYQLANGEYLFIKRQQNHIYRALHTLFLPRATFEREFVNLLRFQKLGIPALDLVYFGQRKVDGNLQSIIATRELKGFKPLDAADFQPIAKFDRVSRLKLIETTANTIRSMHDLRIQHNCLYLKHIFVKVSDTNQVEARLIDLEKAKWRPRRRLAIIRDFVSLQRHTVGWSNTDRLRFFLKYQQEQRLSASSKELLTKILLQIARKNKPHNL
jgi:hypothetical protein